MDAAGDGVRRSSLSGRTHSATALRSLLATALLLVCGHSGLALDPTTPLANYSRQSWVMENGLPQNTVQALIQTRNGFVWLGTEMGLVRFDGNGFAVFDRNSTPALPDSDIRCLLESIKIRALSRGQSRSQGGEDKMGLRWPSLRWFGSTNSRLCSGE